MSCILCGERGYLFEYPPPDGAASFNIWLCSKHKGGNTSAVKRGRKLLKLNQMYLEGKLKQAVMTPMDQYIRSVMILAQQLKTQHYSDFASHLRDVHKLGDDAIGTIIGGLMAKGLLYSPRLGYLMATKRGMEYPAGVREEWRWDKK